jgi:hypothetical protein
MINYMNQAIQYLNPLDLRTLAPRPTYHYLKNTVHSLGFRVYNQLQIGLKIWIATDSGYRGGLCKLALRLVQAMIATCKYT